MFEIAWYVSCADEVLTTRCFEEFGSSFLITTDDAALDCFLTLCYALRGAIGGKCESTICKRHKCIHREAVTVALIQGIYYSRLMTCRF